MASGQTNITGGKKLIGTAQPSDVRMGMTYPDGKELRNGTLDLTHLTPDNIRSGVTIGGVVGGFKGQNTHRVFRGFYREEINNQSGRSWVEVKVPGGFNEEDSIVARIKFIPYSTQDNPVKYGFLIKTPAIQSQIIGFENKTYGAEITYFSNSVSTNVSINTFSFYLARFNAYSSYDDWMAVEVKYEIYKKIN